MDSINCDNNNIIDNSNSIDTNDNNTNTNNVNISSSSTVNPYINAANANDHYKFFARLFDVAKDTPPEVSDDDEDDEEEDDDNNNDDNDNDDNDDNDNKSNDDKTHDNNTFKADTIDNDSNTGSNTATTTTTSTMFTINHVIDAITIQRVYRGRLGRKKRDRTKIIRYRERLQDRYSSSEGVYRFYFEQNGAASKIQQWFRRLPWLIKRKWKAKYAKNIEKQKYVKLQRKKDKIYNRKLAALAFLDGTGDAHSNKELITLSTLLTRFARGHTVRSKLRNMKIKSIKIVIIQSAVRAFLVHCRLPKVGARTRMRLRKEKRWRVLSQIVYPSHLLRRPEIFFPHLKIGDEKNIDLMDKKAFILNRAWRAYKVRRKFRTIQEEKKLRRAVRIQRWYITIRFRKQVKKSLFLLQPFWKFKAYKIKKRHIAATMVQTIVRMRLAFKRCRHIRWYKVRGIYLIQGWARRVFGRRRVRNNNQVNRKVYEELIVGAELFKVTEKLKYIDTLWSGIKKVKKPEASHELQQLFLDLTKQQTTIDIARCTKFALSCPGLLDDMVSVKTIEYLYTKSKPIKESRLNFENFIIFLGNIGAVKYLSIDPERITFKDVNKIETTGKSSKKDKKDKRDDKGDDIKKSASIDEGDENSMASENVVGNDDQSLSSEIIDNLDDTTAPVVKYKKSKLSVDEQMASYRFGRLSGRGAIVTKLTYEFIKLYPEYRKIEILLRDKAANRVSTKVIMAAQKRIRNWIRVRLGIKRMAKVKRLKLANVMKVRKDDAARMIQGTFKSYIGKKILTKLAQSIYTKYIDQESFQPYWFNPRTNKSFWKKPFLLGKADCGIPTTLPLPDEEFAANCLNCERERASNFCDECNEIYCINCYNKLHAKGARRLHNAIPIDTCIQCIFQVGSKFCISCGDSYCDTCYKHIHLKGRLRLHIFDWNCDPCVRCDVRAAQWSKEDSYLGRTLLMCIPCFKEEYGVAPKTSKEVKRIVFQGRFVKEYRLNKRNREEERARKIAYAKQQEEMVQRKRQKSANTIQRVYRGYKCRVRMAGAMEDAKMMTLYREEEDRKRETLVYKFLELLGAAPLLKSDTALMRAKKMFPGYMQHIVEECIQNKWSIACDLLREEENFMKTIGANVSAAEKLSSGMRLKQAQENCKKAQKSMENEKKAYERALVAYRDARANKKTKPEITSSLLEKAKAQEQVYNNSKEIVKEQQTNLEEVTKRVNEIAGPRGLKQYIQEKRKTGILMPFTVSIRKGSRVALTTYPDNYIDPFEPKKKSEFRCKIDENGALHGRWKNRLQPGDMISIEGIIFVLTEKLMLEALEMDEDEKKEDENSEKSESESDSDEDEDGDEEKDGEQKEEEEEFVEDEITDEHLCLDRQWILGNSEGLAVYKLVPKVFYYYPFYQLMRAVLAAYPTQKSSQIVAITMCKISMLNRRIAGLFDPESETAVALNARADRFDEYKVRWMKLSRTPMDMSYDFTLRRQIGGVVYGIMKVGMKYAMKMGRLFAVRSGAIGLSEWEIWHDSNNKVDCECMYEQIGVDPTLLGKFKMDLDAPANIMRSYVRVNFREILNETIGDAFEFYLPGEGDDKQLARTAEPMTYSKDYAPFTLDKNMDGKFIIRIIREKDYRSAIVIPEQTDEVLTGKKSKTKKNTASKEKKKKKLKE